MDQRTRQMTRLRTWIIGMIALWFFIGWWFGRWYQRTSVAPEPPLNATSSEYFSNPTAWQTDERSDAGFTIAYPIDFIANDVGSGKSTVDWRIGANGRSGVKDLSITIPKVFEPQTNFSEAILTVGHSSDKQALAECLKPDASASPTATTTIEVNGVPFTMTSSSDAGAGNFYTNTSYRALRNGRCYAIEYTIHSTAIGNYPPSYGLRPYSESKVRGVLDEVVKTFRFK